MTEDHKDTDEYFEHEDAMDGDFSEDSLDDTVFEEEAAEEFFDDDLSNTDVDTLYEDDDYEEGWDSYEDEGFEEFEDSEPAENDKKSKSNRIIIAGGVVAALAVFYFVLGGGGAPQQSQTPQPTPVKNIAKTPELPKTQTDIIYGGTQQDLTEDPMNPSEQISVNKGLLNDPDALSQITKVRDEYEFEDGEPSIGIAPENTQPPTEPLTPLPEMNAPESTANDAPLSPAETAPPFESTMQNETIVESSVQDAPVPAGKLAEIENKIDSLLSKLETVQSDVEKLRETTKEDFETINSRVDGLVKGVHIKEATTKAAKPAQTSAKTQAATLKKPKTNPVQKPQLPQTTTAAIEDTPAKISKTSSLWTLKGASPGQAIVSPKNSNETYTIVPGQNLSGLGTIQSIQKEEGIWTVRGTYGIIQP